MGSSFFPLAGTSAATRRCWKRRQGPHHQVLSISSKGLGVDLVSKKAQKKIFPTASSCPCRYHPPLQRRGLLPRNQVEKWWPKSNVFFTHGRLKKMQLLYRKPSFLKGMFSGISCYSSCRSPFLGDPDPGNTPGGKLPPFGLQVRSYSVKFFSHPSGVVGFGQATVQSFFSPFASGCSRRFRFRCIYPSLYNQPVQVRSYSVRFFLSPLRCCWCWPSPTNLKLNSPQSDSDWGEFQLKICLAGSTLSWGLRLSVNFLVQVRQCTTVGSPEALSHYLVISQWTL